MKLLLGVTALLLALSVCPAKAAAVPAGVATTAIEEKADAVFLKRQLLVLKLLTHLSQPLTDPELVAIRTSYDPLNSLNKYKDPEGVRRLVRLVTSGRFLEKDEVFSLFTQKHRDEMILLFETFYGAADFATLLGTAVWARDRLNPRQFIYALSVALLHRQDCRGLVLPPYFEITPHMFLTTDVIREVYKAKMMHKSRVIPMKFTGSISNPEQRVAYFGEDVGMNAHHAHWHMDHPFWWKQSYDQRKSRKGELFFYMHHQMVARFEAERLSNDLPPVEELGWFSEIINGFAPAASYDNGKEFPMRPDNMLFHDVEGISVDSVSAYEYRIRDAISAGFVRRADGGVVFLNDTDGINVLGELIESSEHSVNRRYYGQIHNDGHVLLSRITDPLSRYGAPPGVMEHFETATRDPAFFRLHKRVDHLFFEHKRRLAPYTRDELNFPGVVVEAVKVVGTCKASIPNLLVTYFDEFRIDLGNAVEWDEKANAEYKAVVSRLNHEPFRLVVTVRAEKPTVGIARVFLAPKYDWFGRPASLQDLRWATIELDRFPVKLREGENVVVRTSEDSSVTIPEPRSFPDLLKEVQAALRGEQDFVIDRFHRHCGFPHRLLLPKGKPEGMPYLLYVTITDYSKDVVNRSFTPEDLDTLASLSYCGVLEGEIPDARPMGFPFDRRIDNLDLFLTPNAKVIDVTIKNAK